ncbi:MAG TPA: cytochrome c3 family protein, partial [Bryobacteraceae bacterium]|nr:cytochrome c3 family protein [Bryobacteraceae bacterium]
PKGPEILRPLDGSVLASGNVSFVARVNGPAKLLVDGKPAPAVNPAPNALMATLKLEPGAHELVLDLGSAKQTAKVFVGTGSAPAGFEPFRAHPPTAATCDACHAVKDNVWALKFDTTAEACMKCHDATQFPKKHTHVVNVLEECQMCHMPHGSKAASHLKMNKETACKQCHG